MLKQRLITAFLLLLVLIPAMIWLSPMAWAVLMAAVAAVAGWEWAAFMQWQGPRRFLLGLAVLLTCLLCALLLPGLFLSVAEQGLVCLLIYGSAVALWLFIVPFWLCLKKPYLPDHQLLGVLVGLLVIIPAWLAMVQLRAWSPTGFVYLLLVVWIADVGAYAAGRSLGRHKLAPTISPGKTWEGAVGGAAAVMVFGLIVRDVYSLEILPLWLSVLALLVIAIVSVIGDLFESLLKRQVGLKDSSHILPGHGGVMDRIDSLTSTLPLVAMFWLILPLVA